MSSYILCECGKCIGRFRSIILLIKESMILEKKISADEYLLSQELTGIDLSEVLNDFNLNNRCCRIHTLTIEENDKRYK